MTMGSPDLITEAYLALPPSSSSPSPNIHLTPITYRPLLPSSLLLQTTATSLCATDIKAATSKFLLKPPLLLGHEASGTVLAVHSSPSHAFRPGDKVILSYSSCRSCSECLVGANAYCHDLASLNFTGRREDGLSPVLPVMIDNEEVDVAGYFFGQSSMGRRIVVRAESCVLVSRDTTDEDMKAFAALGCGIQTGAGAVLNVARPGVGKRVVVFGAGSVGLAAVLAARLTSPGVLVVVDVDGEKLKRLPDVVKDVLTEAVCSRGMGEEELVGCLKGLTKDGRGFDLALDCVGSGQVVRVGHLALRARGTVVTVGGSGDMALQVTASEHLGRGITFKGTHQGDSVPHVFIPFLIDLWRQGKFPFDKLLTYYKFDQLQQAMQDIKDGKVIKPVLVNSEE